MNASLLLVSHDLQIANQLPRVVTLAELNRASDRIESRIRGRSIIGEGEWSSYSTDA